MRVRAIVLSICVSAAALGRPAIDASRPRKTSCRAANAAGVQSSNETVLLADDFSLASVDSSKWVPSDLFSGFTDSSVQIAESGGELEIGPLKQGASGSHYNGLRSVSAFAFSNSYAYIELISPPSASTAADAMLTVGTDSQHYYRIYYESGKLICQRNVSDKTVLASLTYDPVNHKFLRIRNDAASGDVVFETAPDNSSAPGSWTAVYTESWNVSIPLSGILFEIKAGTWQPESTAPGAVAFDNFRAATVNSTTGPPAFDHVFVVVEENHSYSSVIGNSSMPYFNALAAKYGLATNYYANTHPSIGNYFVITTGQEITNDDSFTGTVSADNIVREIVAAGKTWKSYAESLPAVGYTGGDVYPYARHHNPMSYFSDVAGSSQANNLVPFSQFATDLAGNSLPNYSFIVPNLEDDAHDCPTGGSSCTDDTMLGAADNWLKTNIDPLINSQVFNQGGLLIITFDESVTSDTTNGGGHVPTLVISPSANAAYQSTTLYQHQSVLRLTAEALGLSTTPGAGSTAPDMAEFFAEAPPSILNVSPTSGPTTGGTQVTITGSGFAAGSKVMFGTTAAATVISGSKIVASSPAGSAGTMNITVTNPGGLSATAASGFTYSSQSGETVLLADDFNEGSIDTTKWVPNDLFSGFTDSSLQVGEAGGQLDVGPLKQSTSGSHYDGLRSASTFDFSNSYAYVELITTPSSLTAADAMLTVGSDVQHYYRIYYEGGNIVCQRNAGGTKSVLATVAYNSTNDKFLRIREETSTGTVVFETAPDNSGLPGTWSQIYSEPWNSAIPTSGVIFEIKAGTWQSESSPAGTAVFDNFRAATMH